MQNRHKKLGLMWSRVVPDGQNIAIRLAYFLFRSHLVDIDVELGRWGSIGDTKSLWKPDLHLKGAFSLPILDHADERGH